MVSIPGTVTKVELHADDQQYREVLEVVTRTQELSVRLNVSTDISQERSIERNRKEVLIRK